ncbi:hypothetical protein CABS01_04652 [Colletotrichum abscissum]|uniref:Uncharacterized protein n=2 Tax=Colletotrichum acutatum species complex TaxID=2707335 RepID=A0AAJ0DYQ5_9PEZI|nr:hypothetical protein CSPX01_17153 [Colletotrichum filicis]KAK1472009.1 hypothetical protein CABS01_04652 [Colletotrichum abscissum]KAK1506767.1 hypothetical protein CTAM01_03099 [Colletotrichum tamarilloi]KAK1521919.1 hypothetical protein CCOS01_09631 [Colletotrichum costaricense]
MASPYAIQRQYQCHLYGYWQES